MKSSFIFMIFLTFFTNGIYQASSMTTSAVSSPTTSPMVFSAHNSNTSTTDFKPSSSMNVTHNHSLSLDLSDDIHEFADDEMVPSLQSLQRKLRPITPTEMRKLKEQIKNDNDYQNRANHLLFRAVINKQNNMAQALYVLGADPSIEAYEGLTALSLAEKNKLPCRSILKKQIQKLAIIDELWDN